jgi:hypothetical protein
MTNRLGNRYLGREDPAIQPISIKISYSHTSFSHTVVRKNRFAALILVNPNHGYKDRTVR